MHVRGITAALNSSKKFKYKDAESAVDFLVIGGGVVGLAVARQLSRRFADKSTILLERHTRAGEETSSRNSEVIHAGLYYPERSFKTQLCLRGRQLMYEHCTKNNISHRQVGKLVVARDDQRSYIEKLHAKALAMQPPPFWDPSHPLLPTELINGDRARELEPSLSPDISAALWSPQTGIVDSRELMGSFERDVEDAGGSLAYATRVVRIDPNPDEPGWVVQTVTGDASGTDSDAMHARVLINASGLSAPLIVNALLPPETRIPMYFARGSYASYNGPGVEDVSHLIYPCPDTGKGKTGHGFQSLGTHLTLDLQGKVRFGPDLEWLSPPPSMQINDESTVGFWSNHLIPDASRLETMYEAVTSYMPGVQLDGLQPDYVGIRPKLVGPGGEFQDFVFRTDDSADYAPSPVGRGGRMISLLGIESPGLTSSMAIAEYVVHRMISEEDPV
ncbi:FAD dependent oxidoreductase [Amylostereum chailletii]|nr:FAD dependent oxidoreductase [Amylostereum chailletii]